MMSLAGSIFQSVLFASVAPLAAGMLHWMTAVLQGRRGPSPLQPYFNLRKLFHRQPVVPDTASWVYFAAPLLVFSCFALIGGMAPLLFVPRGTLLADMLMITGLLGLARFATALAGMDTGSPYGGMGSAREMFLHVLAEPALVMVIYALVLLAHTSSLTGALHANAQDSFLTLVGAPAMWFIGLALGSAALAETGQLPFDQPKGHLELSMVSKAIHMEYGGPQLALLEWADAMRLTFFLTLILNLFLPDMLVSTDPQRIFSISNLLAFVLFPLKLGFAIVLLSIWQLTRGKMRLRSLVVPSGLMLAFAILAVFIAMMLEYFF